MFTLCLHFLYYYNYWTSVPVYVTTEMEVFIYLENFSHYITQQIKTNVL